MALQVLDVLVDFVHNSEHAIAKNSILKQILPGTSSSLGKIILGDWKSGTQIKAVSLKLWTKIVVIVMNDTNYTVDNPQLNNNSQNGKVNVKQDTSLETFQSYLSTNVKHGVGHEKKFGGGTISGDIWVETAAQQLHKLISLIFPSSLSSSQGYSGLSYVSPKPQFRLALVQSAGRLLHSCLATLSSSVFVLLETVVLHSDDENLEIAELSKQTLQEEFIAKYGNGPIYGNSFEAVVEDNLHRIMKSLPRIISITSSDADKLIPLKVVAGMKVLGSSISVNNL